MNQLFLGLFTDPAPALQLKLRKSGDEVTIMCVQHRLRPQPDGANLSSLVFLRGDHRLAAFLQFYLAHDGLELCRIYDAQCRGERRRASARRTSGPGPTENIPRNRSPDAQSLRGRRTLWNTSSKGWARQAIRWGLILYGLSRTI